jgi:hypothetical protein
LLGGSSTRKRHLVSFHYGETICCFLGLRPKLIPAFAAEEKAEAKILIAKQKRDVYEAEL